MGNDNMPVVCRACQRTVRMDQVKFDESRKAYVCAACFSASHSMDSIKRGGGSKSFSGKSVEAAPESGSKEGVDFIRYSCPKCKYTFTRKKDKPATACPYCNFNKIEVASKGADKILSESDMYDF